MLFLSITLVTRPHFFIPKIVLITLKYAVDSRLWNILTQEVGHRQLFVLQIDSLETVRKFFLSKGFLFRGHDQI